LLKNHSQSAAVQALVGSMYVTKQDLPAATRAFEHALQLDRDNRDALSELLDVYAQTNHLGEARRLIDSRLATAPNDTGLLMLAARTYSTGGDHPTAEQMLKKVIAQDSANLSAYGMLGQIYISDRRLESARLEYEKAVAKEPTSVAANTIVAMILEAQKKLDEAKKRYLRVLTIDPNAVVAANNLAWLYVQQDKNLDTALELAQRAKRNLATDPRIDDTLGWAYYKKKLLGQAVASLQESVNRDATNPLHQYHLGMAYIQTGDWPRARQALERALRVPDFEGADDARKALTMIGS
jgi:tetratricopeptide (TPR) repeat protein